MEIVLEQGNSYKITLTLEKCEVEHLLYLLKNRPYCSVVREVVCSYGLSTKDACKVAGEIRKVESYDQSEIAGKGESRSDCHE